MTQHPIHNKILTQKSIGLKQASLDANGVGKLRWGAEGTTEAARLIGAGAAWVTPGGPSFSLSPRPQALRKDFVALTFLGTFHEQQERPA